MSCVRGPEPSAHLAPMAALSPRGPGSQHPLWVLNREVGWGWSTCDTFLRGVTAEGCRQTRPRLCVSILFYLRSSLMAHILGCSPSTCFFLLHAFCIHHFSRSSCLAHEAVRLPFPSSVLERCSLRARGRPRLGGIRRRQTLPGACSL